MRFMGWSWTELQGTPLYVRRYCWDLMNARLKAERDANDNAGARMEGARHGSGR
jgi:hypothetical protein